MVADKENTEGLIRNCNNSDKSEKRMGGRMCSTKAKKKNRRITIESKNILKNVCNKSEEEK
jgi:hypothetical protein